MTSLNRVALMSFMATSFLATATILIGYGVSNWAESNVQVRYELPNVPATGEYTAY
jgi:hypothetical protein